MLTKAFGDRLALNDVVATLRRYALIEPAGGQFAVHPLVQVFARGQLDPAKSLEWAAGALRLATAALHLAGEGKARSAVPELVSHVYVAAGHVLRLEGSLDLVSNAMRLALETARRVSGEHDPVFALALRGYGLAQALLGDAEGAERALSQAMVVDLKALGPKDPRVGAGLTSVTGLLVETGRTEEARDVVEHILAMSEDTLGEKHPTTEAIRAELSAFQRSASR